jgi:putative Holliday junction resolvase
VRQRGGRVLALDLGRVRIGLALSDPLGLTANPLETLKSIGARADVERLVRLAQEHGVTRIVVGLPLLLSGEEGDGARSARRFAARLRARLREVEVELWDERLTTVQAERTLISAGVSRRKRRRVVDGLAAVLILQSYLEAMSATPDSAS